MHGLVIFPPSPPAPPMSFVLANASSVARMLHLHNDTTTSTVNSFLVGSLAGLAIVSLVAIAIVRHKRRRAEGTASIEETVVAAAIEEAQCVTVKRARRTLGARKDRLSPESLEEISMGAAQEPLTPTRNVNFDKVYCADRRASRNSRLSRDSRHSRTGGAGGATTMNLSDVKAGTFCTVGRPTVAARDTLRGSRCTDDSRDGSIDDEAAGLVQSPRNRWWW